MSAQWEPAEYVGIRPDTHEVDPPRSAREVLSALAGRGTYMMPAQGHGGEPSVIPRELALQMALQSAGDELGRTLALSIAVQTLVCMPQIRKLALPMLEAALTVHRPTCSLMMDGRAEERLERMLPAVVHKLIWPERPAPRVRMRRQHVTTLWQPMLAELDQSAAEAERAAMRFLRG